MFLSFSTVLATVFIVLNLARPEIHDQTLMPALQSAWFIPHVTVYMFSYSLLGCALILAVAGLVSRSHDVLPAADTLIYIGTAFLTFGMLSGMLWAKQAWGHYCGWDPKETWALITWLIYAAYLHLRLQKKWQGKRMAIYSLAGIVCVLFTFIGVNVLFTGLHSYK